ncbi:MAG TPA: hypothetical protein VH475_11330 [Tepidisphaeraceae bacterium]|jgi:hypothetical protein
MPRPDVPTSCLRFLASVGWTLAATAAVLAQGPPANRKPATTAPAAGVAAPLPSPKAVAIAFAASLDKGDLAVARALIPQDSAHAQWLEAAVALSAALRNLDAAAVARFAEGGKAVSQGRLHIAEAAKALEGAQEKIEGDLATLALPNHPDPVKLKKVDGKWQLQVGPADAAEAQRQVTLYRRLTDAANRTAKEVAAGMYADADTAAHVFAVRVLDARLLAH